MVQYSQIFNIHEENNKVYFYHGSRSDIEKIKHFRGKSNVLPPSTMINYTPLPLKTITLPEGTYTSSINLCWVISNIIRDELGLARKREAMNPTVDRQYDLINVELNGLYFVIEGKLDTPWFLLNIFEDKYERFIIHINDMRLKTFPAFVYADIIENSYLNGKLTRNLSVVPIKQSSGWSTYENLHPNYVPITVKEFSKILIELRDIKGKFIKFNPLFKTIITLSIRPIKVNEVGN